MIFWKRAREQGWEFNVFHKRVAHTSEPRSRFLTKNHEIETTISPQQVHEKFPNLWYTFKHIMETSDLNWEVLNGVYVEIIGKTFWTH